MERYHVFLDERRTTVSLSAVFSSLLALRLGEEPDTEEAHSAIREWLQDKIDEHGVSNRPRPSRWLQTEVLLELVDKKLSTAYFDWLLRIG